MPWLTSYTKTHCYLSFRARGEQIAPFIFITYILLDLHTGGSVYAIGLVQRDSLALTLQIYILFLNLFHDILATCLNRRQGLLSLH